MRTPSSTKQLKRSHTRQIIYEFISRFGVPVAFDIHLEPTNQISFYNGQDEMFNQVVVNMIAAIIVPPLRLLGHSFFSLAPSSVIDYLSAFAIHYSR